MNALRISWGLLNKALKSIGFVISTAFLIGFYFTIFALFALPVRVFTDYLGVRIKNSSWILTKRKYDSLDSFLYEG